jgi:site-specific recombinase XerD
VRQAVNYIIGQAGARAKLGEVWPHMLLHFCGHYMADQGTDFRTMQDYLGHRNPVMTARYTRVAALEAMTMTKRKPATPHPALPGGRGPRPPSDDDVRFYVHRF